jgi:hypothetical protein
MNQIEASCSKPELLAPATGLVALRTFRAAVGVSDTTVWRWIKRGWLSTVNICGVPYVTSEGLAEFKRRAMAGEFAKNIPGRGRNRAQPVAAAI